MGSLVHRAKMWARDLKRDVVALWLAARDPRVPWYAKAFCAAVAAYALSPIDLIPDFVPVLGYLDDLILIPLGIMAAVRMIPAHVLVELRAQASQRTGRPTSSIAAALIVGIWIAAAGLLLWWFWPS